MYARPDTGNRLVRGHHGAYRPTHCTVRRVRKFHLLKGSGKGKSVRGRETRGKRLASKSRECRVLRIQWCDEWFKHVKRVCMR